MLMAALFVSEKLERTQISIHKSINGAIFVQRNATQQQRGMNYLHAPTWVNLNVIMLSERSQEVHTVRSHLHGILEHAN